jgi:hypothetical protein
MSKNYTAKTAAAALKKAGAMEGEIQSSLDRAEAAMQRAIDREGGYGNNDRVVTVGLAGQAAYDEEIRRCIEDAKARR